VKDRARRSGQAREWKNLRQRITTSVTAEDCSYRHQVAALFEATVLGVAVQRWGNDVELWPIVPGTKKHCELRVNSQDAMFFGEAKGMWKEEDRSPKQPGMRAVQGILNDEAQRLVSTVKEAAVQLPSGGPGVCFALCRHSPFVYPRRAGTKQTVYGRVAEELRGDNQNRVDLVAVFHEWNPPDWILITDNAPLESELRRAFDLHWPQQPTACRG